MKNLRNSKATVFAFAILAVAFTSLNSLHAGVILNLADIVGGGNGTGNGVANAGINILDGGNLAPLTGGILTTVNSFVLSPNLFVDGVFVPDGGPTSSASIQVSSTGITVTGISDSSQASTWDHIRNGSNHLVSHAFSGSSVIGAHASKGITFDLTAMETFHSGSGQASSYNITAGTGLNAATADFYLFVDGTLKNTISLNGASQSSIFSGTLNSSDRFLTLITSPRGSFGTDWSLWVNPTVTLSSVAAVPEPSSVVIVMLLGTASFALRFRRKQ